MTLEAAAGAVQDELQVLIGVPVRNPLIFDTYTSQVQVSSYCLVGLLCDTALNTVSRIQTGKKKIFSLSYLCFFRSLKAISSFPLRWARKVQPLHALDADSATKHRGWRVSALHDSRPRFSDGHK